MRQYWVSMGRSCFLYTCNLGNLLKVSSHAKKNNGLYLLQILHFLK